MENPTTNGSRACNLFGDKMQAPVSTIAMQAQFLAARYHLTSELAVAIAALAFGEIPNG